MANNRDAGPLGRQAAAEGVLLGPNAVERALAAAEQVARINSRIESAVQELVPV